MRQRLTTSHYTRILVELDSKDFAHVARNSPDRSSGDDIPQEYGTVAPRGGELAIVMRPVTSNSSPGNLATALERLTH